MSWLNPFDELSNAVWDWVEKLNDFINEALNNPQGLLGSAEYAQSLFEQVWPLSRYIAFLTTFSIATAMVFLWSRGMKYLPIALLSLMMTGVGGVAVWRINQAALGFQSTIIDAVNKFGPSSVPSASSQSVPFPNIGSGVVEGAFYSIELLLLAVLAGVVILVMLGVAIVGAGIMLAFGILAFGETGRKVFRIVCVLWLIAFVAGLPTIALFRRLGQLAAYGIAATPAQQILSTLLGMVVVLLAIVSPFVLYWIIKEMPARITGGNSKATVKGDVDSNVTNTTDVDINADYSDSLKPIDVNVVSDESQPKGQDSASIVEKADSVVVGTLTIGATAMGHPEVAAAVNAADQLRNNDDTGAKAKATESVLTQSSLNSATQGR